MFNVYMLTMMVLSWPICLLISSYAFYSHGQCKYYVDKYTFPVAITLIIFMCSVIAGVLIPLLFPAFLGWLFSFIWNPKTRTYLKEKINGFLD